MTGRLALLALLCSTPLWAATGVSYYADIRPIIEDKCLACHAQGSVAFSYEDSERAYDFRAAIVGAVAARRMPPWMAEPGHQRYLNDYSLTDAQLAHVDLSGAMLIRAVLEGAVLTRSLLRGARLDGAILLSVDFTGADLGQATLAEARIDGARFTDAKLDSTIWINRQRCRSGSVGECQ